MADTVSLPPPDPKQVAQLIHLKKAQNRVGLGQSTIYRWIAERRFPKPVQLGGYVVA